MKLNNKQKTVFVQSISYITLSIITTIGMSPLVLAVTGKVSLNSPEKFNKEQKLAQSTDTNSPERSQLIQQANNLYSQRDFKGAEENLRKLLKKFPKDAFAHFQLGNVLFRQNKA